MQTIIKHPLLLTLVTIVIASSALFLWYMNVERLNVSPTEDTSLTRAALEEKSPNEYDVPPADLLPATPAVLPEL